MRTWAKATAPAALLAVAVMSFGGGTSYADTSGDASVGGGNQVDLPITLPIDISGNSVGAVGSSRAASQGGASVENVDSGGGIPNRTSGNASVLGGNQINAPITAPINACGNALSLVGRSNAGCKGGSAVKNVGRGTSGGNHTAGDASVLGGNQITAPITAPIDACGNAVAIIGNAAAGCKGGAFVKNIGKGASGGNRASGRASVLGGNQVIAPITAPINICGNAVAAVGHAFAGCKGGSSVTNVGHPGHPGHHGYFQSAAVVPGSSGNDTDGRFGVGSGNQIIAPITLPITACGNAVGTVAKAECQGGAFVRNLGRGTGAGGNTTSGQSGVLSGNQAIAPITAPIDICGNAVALVGNAFAKCKGGAYVENGGRGAGGNTTSGRAGVLAGNQILAPITAPINACGNAIAAIGLAKAHCEGGASVPGHANVGAGGNTTSGRAGVLAGNQVVAPITAPLNICGNAVAVLGDAAAGCLGGSHVGGSRVGRPIAGGPQWMSYDPGKTGKAKSSGLLPALPDLPLLGALPGADGLGQLPMRAPAESAVPGGVPMLDGALTAVAPAMSILGGVPGLSALPALPGLPATPLTPEAPAKEAAPGVVQDMQRKAGKTPKGVAGVRDNGGSASPLDPATSLVASTPVGSAVSSTAKGLPVAGGNLPVGDIGLMSAAQPAGLTGMTGSSLVALMLGAMFAVSATLFGATRRFRLGRR